MEYLDGLQKRKEEKKTNRTKAALLQQKLVERDAYCSDMTDEENVMLWRASVQRIGVNFDSTPATVLWTFGTIASHLDLAGAQAISVKLSCANRKAASKTTAPDGCRMVEPRGIDQSSGPLLDALISALRFRSSETLSRHHR